MSGVAGLRGKLTRKDVEPLIEHIRKLDNFIALEDELNRVIERVKMPQLHFKLDADRLELGQIIGMMDGNLKDMRDVMALCLTDDETGDYYEDTDAARAVVNKIKLSQVKNTAADMVKQLNEGAVNPTTAAG